MLDAYPDDIKVENSMGRLPLHVACVKDASLAVINLLVEAYPDAVNELDEHGWKPYWLAKRNCSDEKITNLLQQTEKKLRTHDSDDDDADETSGAEPCFICKSTNRRILLYAIHVQTDEKVCIRCAEHNGYDEQGDY